MIEYEIDISIQDFDEGHVIVFVEENGEDMSFTLALYDFQIEMEYWDMPCTIERLNGKIGYVFNKEEQPYLKAEIRCFIKKYDLDKKRIYRKLIRKYEKVCYKLNIGHKKG